jgi:hypothetical protein
VAVRPVVTVGVAVEVGASAGAMMGVGVGIGVLVGVAVHDTATTVAAVAVCVVMASGEGPQATTHRAATANIATSRIRVFMVHPSLKGTNDGKDMPPNFKMSGNPNIGISGIPIIPHFQGKFQFYWETEIICYQETGIIYYRDIL